MIDILKSKITQIVTIALLAFASLAAVPAVASAQTSGSTPDIQGKLCQGAADLQFGSDQAADCQTNAEATTSKVNTLVTQIINIFSVVVGIVAVIMIIIGGFRYITSGGDSGNVTGAKNTILYAIIGLVIVALSQFIVKFVLAKATQQA